MWARPNLWPGRHLGYVSIIIQPSMFIVHLLGTKTSEAPVIDSCKCCFSCFSLCIILCRLLQGGGTYIGEFMEICSLAARGYSL